MPNEETETKETAKPVVAKIEQNGVARPKPGTKTGRVWEISDAESATTKEPAKRKAVVDTAVAEGINASTAATQYGRWRKFNGLEKEVKAAPAPVADEGTTEEV